MEASGRPYRGEWSDDVLIAELLTTQPDDSRHVLTQGWRLSCPAAADGQRARLWDAPDGRLAGYAAWQGPWAALDLFVRPGVAAGRVGDAIFGWAEGLFADLDAERGRALPYWIEARADDADARQSAARRGYTLAEARYTCLNRPLTARDGVPLAPPPGLRIRQLAGAAEADASARVHRAAFGSELVTAQWRARTLSMPQYRRDLDLVAETADGELAGYILGWLDPGRGIGEIEPLAVAPAFRGQGTGLALVRELVRRLAASGARLAVVETEADNEPAVRTYQAAGFTPVASVVGYGRLAGPA